MMKIAALPMVTCLASAAVQLAPPARAQSGDLAVVLEGTITQELAPVVGPLSGAAVGDRFTARFVVGRTPTPVSPGWVDYPYVFQRGSLTIEDERAMFDSLSPLTLFWVADDQSQLGDAIDAYVGIAQSDFELQFALRDPTGQMIDSSSLLDLVGVVPISSSGTLSQILLRDPNMDATTIGHILRAEVVDLTPHIGDGYCVAATNSSGTSATIAALGDERVALNDVRLECRRLPQFSFGFFVASRSAGYVPQPAGGHGTLCLGGSIGRFGAPVPSSGSTGVVVRDVDLTALPTPLGTTAAFPGDTWYFQCWFRDSFGSSPTSNFSDSVRVQFS